MRCCPSPVCAKEDQQTNKHTFVEVLIADCHIFIFSFAVSSLRFPEGLAVGVGFGAIGSSESATFAQAWYAI